MPKFRLSEAAEAAGKSVATRVKDKKTGASDLVIWDKKNGVEHDVPEDTAVRLREQYKKGPTTKPNPVGGWLVEVPAEKPAPAPAAPGGAPGPK